MTACFSLRRIIIFAYIHICPRRRIPHTAFLAFSRNRRGPVARLLLKILLQIPRLFWRGPIHICSCAERDLGPVSGHVLFRIFFYCTETIMDVDERRYWMFHSREIGHWSFKNAQCYRSASEKFRYRSLIKKERKETHLDSFRETQTILFGVKPMNRIINDHSASTKQI